MTTDTFINATSDPSLANKLAEKAMSDTEAVVTTPKVQLPPDPTVELPGGLHDPIHGHITTAQVRELIGSDEEAVTKLNDIGKALLLILDRATVKLGDVEPEKEMLDALLSGDREAILLKIRMMTFGSDVKMGPGKCPSCGEEQIWDIDLVNDVPVKILEGSREFTMQCKVGEVVVSLPTGGTQKEIINSTNKTSAEIDTIVLKSCIKSINGLPVFGLEAIRSLSIKDRRDILQQISDRNPGPQLGDVKKACSACGTEVPLPLTLAELF